MVQPFQIIPDPTESFSMLMLGLLLAACLRSIFSLWHAWIVHAFVHSKPPGRKMVSNEHLKICLSFSHFHVYVLTFGFIQLESEEKCF